MIKATTLRNENYLMSAQLSLVLGLTKSFLKTTIRDTARYCREVRNRLFSNKCPQFFVDKHTLHYLRGFFLRKLL